MKDESRQEEAEVIDFGKIRAEDDEEGQKVEEELRGSKEQLHTLNTESITHLLAALNGALDKNDDAKVLNLMWQLDQSETVCKLREWWRQRSPFTQKYLYYSEALLVFRYLVVFGMLEVKGWNTQEVSKREYRRVSGSAWALKIIGLLVPEMAVFKPLLNVFIKLQGKLGKLGEKSRAYLTERRAQDQLKSMEKDLHGGQPAQEHEEADEAQDLAEVIPLDKFKKKAS